MNFLRNLHEFDGCPVRVAHVDDAFAGIRPVLSLCGLPAAFQSEAAILFEHSVEIVNEQRNMH